MPIGSDRDYEFGEADNSSRRRRRRRGARDDVSVDGTPRSTTAPGESSWQRGMRRMENSDALELNSDALLELEQASQLLDEERRQTRHIILGMLAALILLFFFSELITVSYYSFIDFGTLFDCLGLWLQQTYINLFTTQEPLSVVELQTIQPYYFEVSSRALVSLVTIFCGAVLALSGTLYQNVFRNPIAAPTMLGVSSGVNLGLVVLVILLGASAPYAVGMRYLLCFGGGLLVLIIVFGSGRLMQGGSSFNVVNMMLVGSIISQLMGIVVQYITYFWFDEDLYEVYYELQEMLNVDVSGATFALIGIVLVASVIPIFFLRFSMNALSFPDSDSRVMGVNANLLRFVALACGSIMVLAAQMLSGMISMLSLLVPHISRALFGAEFKKQFFGNMLLGALLLLLCRDISALIPFVDSGLPISTVVSFVTLPFFVWMLAVQQRSWT